MPQVWWFTAALCFISRQFVESLPFLVNVLCFARIPVLVLLLGSKFMTCGADLRVASTRSSRIPRLVIYGSSQTLQDSDVFPACMRWFLDCGWGLRAIVSCQTGNISTFGQHIANFWQVWQYLTSHCTRTWIPLSQPRTFRSKCLPQEGGWSWWAVCVQERGEVDLFYP